MRAFAALRLPSAVHCGIASGSAPVGELTELGHRGALLVPGQFAPPSVMPRRTGELGDEYTVRFSPQTILVHLARIEHDYAKSNLNSKNIA